MFQTVHYEIKSKKIKNPVTVVMLADLHNHLYGERNERLLSEIGKQHPDLICLAGDMLIGEKGASSAAAQETVLALARRYPVFYAFGNHESRMFHQPEHYGNGFGSYIEPLKEAGVRVLVNESADAAVGHTQFRIYGYDLPLKYFKKFNRYKFEAEQLAEALGDCDGSEETFTMLLAHNPVYFQQYAAWGADLTLSGHLHGGIIRLPLIGGVITPQAKLFPRYSAGLYQRGEKKLIVSRGLGTHTVPIRFRNPPELSVIHMDGGI